MSEFRKVREVPTEVTKNPNISTENQPEGAARRPSDTLDRERKRDPESGSSNSDNYDPEIGTRVGEERDTRAGRAAEGLPGEELETAGNPDIWEQRGTLTIAHDQSDGAELPPLAEERAEPQPLREILGRFAAATSPERERYSLVLENGQAFSHDDIVELLGREDSPFR
ncbi:hypothetical protein GGC65_001337 [Sphingopyxis sp. OAS728]|uniref:hypothetical protein n=1 Tax=Sphingopyxis sp. OAS728 TaxID=2663823 RepID=UPI0019EA03C6|nr:hypothetical protein [Sphingopyxis sp. OAS728]MBE1526881.1 hypothetical protein [Sphingopyxis sp. OAS728]